MTATATLTTIASDGKITSLFLNGNDYASQLLPVVDPDQTAREAEGLVR
jgi:hypothetical protein